jgi:hypothetical protein
MIFDAGAFIALDKRSKRRIVLAIVEQLRDQGEPLRTTSPVLAQAWRDPARQAAMARLAKTMDVLPFGDSKTIGLRCGDAGTNDVVDADLAIWADVLVDTILTTDPRDLTKLHAKHVVL